MFFCLGNRQQAYDNAHDMNVECALYCLYVNAHATTMVLVFLSIYYLA